MTVKHESEIQNLFFKLVKERISPDLNPVEEISDLLDISVDSAYRRFRGEKNLSLDELYKIAHHYHISLDTLTSHATSSDLVTFNFKSLDEENFTFEQYYTSQLKHFSVINSANEIEMIYAAKDMPAFYYFNIHDLAVFKIFVWKKSIMGLEKYEHKNFYLQVEHDNLINLGKQCLSEYCKTPGWELWNDESVNSTLRQIEVYYEMGIFDRTEDAVHILNCYSQLIDHLETQAKVGKKFLIGNDYNSKNADFQLYNNEVVLCDNSILATADNQRMLFLTHNTLNYLYINNKHYCDLTYDWMKNLQKRSVIISSVSEKHRIRFFNNIRKKIENTRSKIIA